jgi:hypothetical protein
MTNHGLIDYGASVRGHLSGPRSNMRLGSECADAGDSEPYRRDGILHGSHSDHAQEVAMRARFRTLATLAVAITTLAATTAAAPATAATGPPAVQVHYSDLYDVLLPDPSDRAGSFCGGLTNVPLHVEIDGYFSIKDHGPNAPAPYFADRFRSTLVYTNPQTGLTYTVVRVRQSKDLKIVDNGDGTLTLTGLNSGSLFAYGPDGELLGRQNGLTRETFLVDTLGTPDPNDDVLTPWGDPFTAGLTTTTGFCNDFLSATSG